MMNDTALGEQDGGRYDFSALYEALGTDPHLDRATYIGPLAIMPSAGRGCGVFTTRAVKLLLCEKAFAYCDAAEGQESTGSKPMLMDVHDWNLSRKSPGSCIRLLYRNSRLNRGNYLAAMKTHAGGVRIIDTYGAYVFLFCIAKDWLIVLMLRFVEPETENREQ